MLYVLSINYSKNDIILIIIIITIIVIIIINNNNLDFNLRDT